MKIEKIILVPQKVKVPVKDLKRRASYEGECVDGFENVLVTFTKEESPKVLTIEVATAHEPFIGLRHGGGEEIRHTSTITYTATLRDGETKSFCPNFYGQIDYDKGREIRKILDELEALP